MKCFFLLSVAIAACAASIIRGPIGQQPRYQEGDRYFYFAGDDEVVHLVDAEEPIDTAFIEEFTRNPANNGYWLFTRANPNNAQVLQFNNINSIINSNFVASKVTVFLAHGWYGNGSNEMNKLLVEAFLLDADVNVIVLDWSALANRSYITAKDGTAAVGRGLGQFVNWLVNIGMSEYNRIHLVGFSLGGHLVGNAGKETGSKVRRITALDPAGPLWSRDSNRIVQTDAQYVEVIHTNTGTCGFTDPCGDADFYPNGGSCMPSCWFSSCSHSMSYKYMASTVKHNNLHANECGTYRDATRDRCTGSLNPMGNSDLNKSRRGIFRVNTGRNYAYQLDLSIRATLSHVQTNIFFCITENSTAIFVNISK